MIYASRAVMDLSESEMEAFLGTSRDNNAEVDVTGCLLHVHDVPRDRSYFVQLLEGPEGAVEHTYARIRRDSLHRDVTAVHRGHRDGRAFEAWRMRLATITTDTVFSLISVDPVRLSDARPTFDLLMNPSMARALLELEAGVATPG
nr:BLUF domain-containing protein [Kineosporia babensis]